MREREERFRGLLLWLLGLCKIFRMGLFIYVGSRRKGILRRENEDIRETKGLRLYGEISFREKEEEEECFF